MAAAELRSSRYLELDLLRTIAIVMMVTYHIAYDLAFFYGFPLELSAGPWHLLQRVTANLFLVLVGVSFAVSAGKMEARGKPWAAIAHRSAERAAILLAWGTMITIVTSVFLGDIYVRFGILHLIAASLLLLPFLLWLREWNALLATAVFFIGGWTQHISASSPLLLPFGFTPPSFITVDYFPLFPWLAAILLGVAVGNLLYNRGWLRWHVPHTRILHPLGLSGRSSLAIYLVHQPLLLSILWLLFRH